MASVVGTRLSWDESSLDGMLASVLDALPARTAIVDADGNLIFTNDAWKRFAESRRQPADGENYFDYLNTHFEGPERIGMHCTRGLRGVIAGELPRFELDYPTTGQNFRWFHLHIRPIRGEEPHFLVQHEDVTEKKLTDEKWRSASRFQKVILDHAGYALILTETSGLITNFNPAAERMLGYPSSEVVGKRNLLDLLDTSEAESFPLAAIPNREVILRFANEEDGIEREWKWIRQDGLRVPVLLSISALRAEDGTLTGFVAMAVDISARKRVEAQLSQAQRLESIGQLAAGIAHEINTPMQFVSDNVEFLGTCFHTICTVTDEIDRQLSGPPLTWEEHTRRVGAMYDRSSYVKLRRMIDGAISDCRDGCDRIVSIVRAMRQLSHPGTATYERVDLNELIRSTCTVSRNRWKQIAELKLILDANLPPVRCHVAEISQVFLNLVVNAADAIVEHLGERPVQKGEIRIHSDYSGDAVLIRISDTGTGIPEDIRDRIFDPFFTTKGVGKGTGQGLSLAYDAVVNRHRGSIQVVSKVGSGSTFIVSLPVDHPSGPLSGMWKVGRPHDSRMETRLNSPALRTEDDWIG